MTADPVPLVSIGVPVYNEERFLDAALSALRAQDYPRLEILVCDNASTDATPEICARHARLDPRLTVHRAERNAGVTENFRRAFALARGEYFMWAGGHDLTSPNLVSEAMALLLSHPEASLAFATTRWIDADGQPLARESGWTDTRGLAPAARLLTVLWGNMHPVMGVIRSAKLRACAPLPNIVGGDLVLLSELALAGDFLHACGATWSRREVRVERRHQDKLRRYADATTRIASTPLARRLPLLRLPFALLALVLRAPRPPLEKAAILAALLPSLALRLLIGRQNRYDA